MSRGRHRRPRKPLITRHVSRVSLALTTGGAGIALPLADAGSASAAPVSVWDKVADCESGGDWSINTGNGFYGGLQFTQSSWAAADGTQYAPSADQASKDQQIATAEKLLSMQGPDAWPVCGARAGLSQNSGTPDITPDGRRESVPQAAAKPETEAGAEAGAESKPKAEPSGPQQTRTQRTDTTDYTITSGDTLYGIAASHSVEGGWKTVYETNREVIGGDPALIFPGQILSLAEGEARSSDAPEKPEKPEKPEAEQKATPKAEKPEAPAEKTSTNAGGFTAPVDARPGTAYRASGAMWSSGYHTGVDFSAPSGSKVMAVADGTVVSAGWGGAYGNEVVIRHTDGHYSQYAHLSSVSVRSGQTVSNGDRIGLSGSTGNSSGPHLHFEMRTGPSYGSDIDPVAYLRSKGVSL